VGGANDGAVEHLRSYGFDLGLAFQHADDLKDAEFGVHRKRAHQRAVDLTNRAARTAERFGDPGAPLVALAKWVEQRAKEAMPGEHRPPS
jgi:hypothetical protein